MAPSSTREVVNIFWPMTLPAYASFSINSPFPLKFSYPRSASVILTLEAPVHFSSPISVQIIPSGFLSPGFASGWCSLPIELKLAILRHNVLYNSVIWPANANAAMHSSLFPYLRMTPEIAHISRNLFFAENAFVILPQQEALSMFRNSPPPAIRPFLRRVTLLTWLEPRDWETIDAVAQETLGFEGLTHVEVRCSVVKFVRSFCVDHGFVENDNTELWSVHLNNQLPSEVRFRTKGILVFDRPQLRRGGMDERLWERVEQVEGLMKEKFKFGV